MYFDHKAYGERIKRLRTGRELTQEQLAEKINVSRTYIVKIENGLQIGPIEIAIVLRCLHGFSLAWKRKLSRGQKAVFENGNRYPL